MCLKSRQSSRTVAGEARTYDLSACLQVMPNAHNLTGYGPTQLWVLRTSRYVVFGQGTGGQRTLHKSTPVPKGATAPQFVPRLHVAVYASESIRIDSEMPRNLGSFIRKARW
eukprot:jgi/Botrbrau1/14491/Bobra.0014s0125.1